VTIFFPIGSEEAKMVSRKIAITAALMLGLGGGTALAQVDQTTESFYADPVLPDPSPVPARIFAPALATADVATVTPAAGVARAAGAHGKRIAARATACTALSPCAVTAPAARG
jgi:hypothetical protein